MLYIIHTRRIEIWLEKVDNTILLSPEYIIYTELARTLLAEFRAGYWEISTYNSKNKRREGGDL